MWDLQSDSLRRRLISVGRLLMSGRNMYTNQPPLILRAKSPLRNGEIISLERHLRETEQAAIQIFRLDGRWGRNWCRFFQIQEPEGQQKFLLNLRVAALFHDIGKANADFYSAVCGD